MKCEKCGTEYEGNVCPNGCNAPAAVKKKKPIFKKWWFWLIIAVVLISVIAGGSGSKNEEPVAGGSEVTQTEDEAGNEEVKQEDHYYNVGDTIDANGLKILYVSAEKWEGYNEYSAPAEGNMVVRIKISAENTASTDRYISGYEFECYADGKKAENYYYADDTFTDGDLSTGRSAEGYIYYEVPVNAQEIEVEYETNLWTDKKATLKVVI